MKSSSSVPASTPLLPVGVRQLQWLLFSLLVCGFLLALPAQESTSIPVRSDRADHLFADTPFIVATNDWSRAVRSDDNAQRDDSSGNLPLHGLPADFFHLSISSRLTVLSYVSFLFPLPVSTLPGAPRGPPVIPR